MAAGLLTGALQWLALERVELTSPIWMFASGLSFAGSFGLADLLAGFHWVSYAGTGIYLAIVLGSVFALLTAIPAGILISRPKYQVR